MTDNERDPPKVARSMEEVGRLLGISRARVMQLEHAALKKLARHPVLRQLAIDLGVVKED